jgi:anti-anti-sigma factor
MPFSNVNNSESGNQAVQLRGEVVMLNVEHKNLGTVSLLNLAGQVVIGETGGLLETMQTLPASSTVILDLSHVTLVDAHGLGVMLQLREYAEAAGANFELMNASDSLRELFRITRLDSVFHFHTGVEYLPLTAQRSRIAA